jgi:cell division protein FtsB
MDIRVKPFSAFHYLRKPKQGIEILVDHAPQAEEWATRTRQRLDPAVGFFQRTGRQLATVAVVALTAWLAVHVMLGANGIAVYRQKKSEYGDLQKSIDGLQKENDAYTAHIKGLKSDPAVIEKEAREQLHYARPGEVIYVAPSTPVAQTPTNNSAKK